MPAPRVLFVKLSSLGDVIHHLPAVTDLAEHRPGARIAWAVEEAYVDLVTLHPAVAEAIPVGLRGLRRAPPSPPPWGRVSRGRPAPGGRARGFVGGSQGALQRAPWARGGRA